MSRQETADDIEFVDHHTPISCRPLSFEMMGDQFYKNYQVECYIGHERNPAEIDGPDP